MITSPDSSDHYSHLKVELFCNILKSGDGRIDTTVTVGFTSFYYYAMRFDLDTKKSIGRTKM